MNSTIKKWTVIIAVAGLVVAGSTVAYMFFMPHRDVQATAADYQISAQELINETLEDPNAANKKYLDDEGESKILEVSGVISSIDEDMNHQKVVLLKGEEVEAGVSCSFTESTNSSVEGLIEGVAVVIKGQFVSGAAYDEDMELYEDVRIIKCDIVNK